MKTKSINIKIVSLFIMMLLMNLGFSQQNNYIGQSLKSPDFDLGKTGPVLFDQISNPGTSWMVSHHYTTLTNNTLTSAAADDFDVPAGESWDVHSIGILGSYWQGDPGGGDTLNVYILNDNNGVPGDTLYGYPAHTNFQKQEEQVGDAVKTYFEIILPSVLTFDEGTFWVSVQMVSSYDLTGQWGWADHQYAPDPYYGAQWHWINPKDGFGLGYTYWVNAENVVGPWAAWELSFALYAPPLTNDLSVMSITSPEDYFYGPPAVEQEVKVLLRNEGTTPQTGFDITYNINGTEITENIGTVTLDYNDTYEYTFTQTVDLSTPGFYDLDVSAMVTGDENPDNNTQYLGITVFDPTEYLMPSMEVTYDSTCSGTFTDSEGLDGDLWNDDDWGVYTIYPASPGAKIRLEFVQFDIGWGEFYIFDGPNTNATLLGFWESYDLPGTITASYGNTSGALTIQYEGQGWTPFEGHTGWAANIVCHAAVEDDFEVMGIELSHPAVFEHDYVTAYATIKNNGTEAISKDVTYSANGITFATTNSGLVLQSDTVIVEALWNPTTEGDYTLVASIPDDMGGSNDNSQSMMQHVYPFDHFYEGFELPLFPPDGWAQSSTMWTHHTYSPSVGEGHAYAWVEYGLVDTLYTPRLHIEEGDVLEFYAYSSAWWPGEIDFCYVDAETGEATLIEALTLPFMWYTTFEIDVTAAAGDNYLAFVAKYNPIGGQGEVKLDEVNGIGIERFYYEDDLKAYVLSGDITPEENIETSVDIDIKNIGSEVQLGSAYTVKLMQAPAGIELMSYPGQDINPKEVLTFTLDYTFPYAGLYNCYVEVDFAEDQDISNNISTNLNIYVQQEGTEQVQIGEQTDYSSNWWHPITISTTGLYSQTVFLADEVGEANTITGIMYYYRLANNYPVYDNPITIWMSETEENNMDGPLEAANNYDLVFEGTFDAHPGYHGVYIPLDFVYSYQGGNLMVTTYKDYDVGGWAEFYVGTSHVADTMVRYYNGYANNEPIDPYVQSTLDSVYQHHKTEYGNVKLFKFNLEGQYCTPQVLSGTSAGDYIDGVTFGEIENLGTGSLGGPAYNNYTSMSANVERGRTYEMTINAETSGSNGSIAAWIDFNGNKELDDEGEKVVHISSDEASQEITVLVTIPDDAALGLTILRIRNSSEADLFASCQAVDYGETEDYGLNIIETIQVYNPVQEFTATLLEDGMVDLDWTVPENPGVAYVEGFEMSTWPPEGGWEVKQSISLTDPLIDPTGDTWTQYDEDMDFVYNGAFSALCPSSAMDFNWLITPEVQLYGNDELSFMLNYSADASGYSKLYVLVEADEEWNTVLEYTDETTMYNNFDEPVIVNLEDFAGKVVRLAFVSEYNNAYPIAIDDAVLKGAEPADKSVSGIESYDIYKNGDFFANIEDASIIEYSDELSVTENYIYCIHVNYDDGEKSEELCDNVFYLAPLTSPLNVVASADANNVSVKWIAPDGGMMRFTDDFEDYNVGEQLACQNPEDWTTWTLSPCSSADPYVTDDMPYSGDNSVVIEYEADLLYLMDDLLTEGKYSYSFRIYIPEGFNGYFNVLQDHDLTVGALWAMQAFFEQNGIGTLDAGGYGAATFIYDYDEWMSIEVIADLDTDWGEFLIDGELIHEWQWSTGISGGSNGWATLEGGDFYSYNAINTNKYFIDDFQIIQLYESDDLLDYNVYRDGDFLEISTITEFDDTEVAPGYHDYCVSAIYDEGESDQVCDWVSLISAPENFTAVVENENDVVCNWEAATGTGFLGYNVYRDDEVVSGLVANMEWTDENVEGGTHTYYVTAVYDGAESLPSNMETVVILITPTNLIANADGEGDIVLNWDGVGEVVLGNMVELYQHDDTPANGFFQWFNIGYGVIFDISAYPDASVEMVDFHHSSYGTTGTWSYMFHIVDWTTFTEIGTAGPFQTTGDDIWELEIPMGSVPATSNQIGIFMEPMSNDPQDAYPILSIDASVDGFSLSASVFDYTQNDPNTNGDFLLDLWIWAPTKGETVQAKKVNLNNSTNAPVSRSPFVPVNGEITINQKVKGGKALTGYNVYYSHNSDPFEFLDMATDTTYLHEDAGMIVGLHNYYVTSNYEEGESESSNIATVILDGVSDIASGNMHIYPNPVIDVVNIETEVEILSVLVVNSKGQAVLSKEGIKSNVYQFNLANQPSGIFNVRIETENGWINRKLIKK